MDAESVIKRIADIAETIAWQAGVGGMETAGAIVSYLAEHPDQIDTLFRDGVFETTHMLADYPAHGCLTFHGQNGQIVTPAELRRAKLIKKLEKSA